MNNEPSTDIPPPKRPWGFWKWLMLLTPSVVVLVILPITGLLDLTIPLITGRSQSDGFLGRVFNGILPPIGPLLCIILGTNLSSHLGTKGFFGWLLCCLGVAAVNLAILFSACAMTF